MFILIRQVVTSEASVILLGNFPKLNVNNSLLNDSEEFSIN